MAAVVIEREETRSFEFSIEGSKTMHSIPLAAYLPYPFMRRLVTVDSDKSFALELLHEFCPELEEDGKLHISTVMTIYRLWEEASNEDGASPGE